MPVLNIIQSAGRALRADARNYFFAAFAALMIAVLPIPGKLFPLLFGLIIAWAVLCVLSAFPDKTLNGYEKRLSEESEFAEKALRERDAAREERTAEAQKNALFADMLCTQFYLRITERLRAEGFPNASWDFITPKPDEALISGDTVRIKLNSAGDFASADVQFAPRSGVLKLSVSKPVQDIPAKPVEEVKKTVQSAARKNEDDLLEKWLKEHASNIEDVGFEANKRGKTSYTYTKDLPDKALWPRLAELLEADEFYEHVEAADDGLLIQIKVYQPVQKAV